VFILEILGQCGNGLVVDGLRLTMGKGISSLVDIFQKGCDARKTMRAPPAAVALGDAVR